MRVVVADRDTLVRQRVVAALRAETGVEVVGEAADGPAALAEVERLVPDLLVLDLAMPGIDGTTVAEQLRGARPRVRILLLSLHDDDGSLERAVKLQASGFVSKSASIGELVDALRAVRDGRSYLSSDVASRVLSLAAGNGGVGGIGLTSDERGLLDRLVTGQRPGEIATGMQLASDEVVERLHGLYRKLDVETAAQAVVEAYRRGLVTPA